MAAKCAWCGTANVQALADRYGCFECDRFTLMDGTRADDGLRWTSEKAPREKEPYEQYGYVGKNQSRKRANLEAAEGKGDALTTTQSVGPKAKKRKKAS